ncbi:MAG: hypothetical protein ACLU3I_15805 [Acutalibacteraceae bacterium]
MSSRSGEAVRAEQNRPVGDIARLLHGADAGLVLLVQALFLGLGRFQLGLLVGDQQAVLLHLLVQVVDGRLRHADLLVDIGFLIDERLRFGLVFLDLCLKRFALLFELCLLIAKAGELFLISELDAALTMIMRALETRPSSITAANTKQTIRRAEPLFFVS